MEEGITEEKIVFLHDASNKNNKINTLK